MNRLTRTATALTAAAVLGFSLTACGEDEEPNDDETSAESSETSETTDDATDDSESVDTSDATDTATDETDASDDSSLPVTDSEFCEVFVGSFDAIGTDETPTEENWAAFQAELEKLDEIGIPDDAPEDAQEGFEVFVDALGDLDYDEAVESFDEDELPGVSPEDNAKAEAFTQWAFTECLDLGDIPSETATQ